MNVQQAHALAHELEELADLLKEKARNIRQALRHPAETKTPLGYTNYPDIEKRKRWLP